jgi:hypothetical protein
MGYRRRGGLAATDGPSDPGNFTGLGTVSGMRRCSAGRYRPFDAKAAGSGLR